MESDRAASTKGGQGEKQPASHVLNHRVWRGCERAPAPAPGPSGMMASRERGGGAQHADGFLRALRWVLRHPGGRQWLPVRDGVHHPAAKHACAGWAPGGALSAFTRIVFLGRAGGRVFALARGGSAVRVMGAVPGDGGGLRFGRPWWLRSREP